MSPPAPSPLADAVWARSTRDLVSAIDGVLADGAHNPHALQTLRAELIQQLRIYALQRDQEAPDKS